MNQYLFSVHSYDGQPTPTPEVMQQMFRDVDAFNAQMREEKAWVFAGGLHEPSTATVVRVDGPEPTFTDGPFAEAREHLGGFWVLKAPNLDAALKLAVRAAKACRAPVEVRPFQDGPEECSCRAAATRSPGRSARLRAGRPRRWPDSSAISISPRRWFKTRSSSRSIAGRTTASRRRPRAGS